MANTTNDDLTNVVRFVITKASATKPFFFSLFFFVSPSFTFIQVCVSNETNEIMGFVRE